MRVREIIEVIKEHVEGKQYGKELVLKECPYCNRTKNRFYINVETGQFSCKSASCGARGNLNTLLPKIGLDNIGPIEYDDAKAPVKPSKAVHEIKVDGLSVMPEEHDLVGYMLSRGISYDTIKHSGVLHSSKHNALTFITKFENRVVGCLYRKPGKKLFMEAGSEQRLWGIQTFKGSKDSTLYITEGHPDCLTLREMGYWNSVSVPNGAASHEWINRDWEWLQQFEKIVLCYDNDDAGKAAILEVKNRLDFAQLYELEYGDCNDINEMFMVDCEGLFKTVRNPKEISMDGFISLKGVTTNSDPLSMMGSCGISQFDRMFGGMRLNETTIIAAASGAGKTTVMSNLINGFMSQGEGTAVWSGELTNATLKTWIYSVIAGEKAITTIDNPYRPGEVISMIKPEYEMKIDAAVDGKLHVYDGNKSNGFKMLEHFALLHKRHGIKNFIIDNGSILDMTMHGSKAGKYDGEEAWSKEAAKFVRNNPVRLFIVMHPTKTTLNADPNYTNAKGRVKKPEMYDQYQIRGSASIPNLANNIMFLLRAGEHYKAWMCQKAEDSLTKLKRPQEIPRAIELIQRDLSLVAYLAKNRGAGHIFEETMFGYSQETRRIYGLQTKEEDLSKEFLLEEKQDYSVPDGFDNDDFDYSDF